MHIVCQGYFSNLSVHFNNAFYTCIDYSYTQNLNTISWGQIFP